MKKRSLSRHLSGVADFLPEVFTAQDRSEPAEVHRSHVAWEPFPGRPPRVRVYQPGPLVSPEVKYCTHCGESATRGEEYNDDWAKRRKCGRCQSKPRARGERQSVLYCMHCRTQFTRPAGLSTRALCDDCQRQSDERKGIKRR